MEDMLANRLQFLDRKASAERRLGDEPDVRDHVLVARMHASVVAVDFILRSLERIGTAKKLILGKNIAILSNRGAVYFPRGRYPARTLSAPCMFQPRVVEILACIFGFLFYVSFLAGGRLRKGQRKVEKQQR